MSYDRGAWYSNYMKNEQKHTPSSNVLEKLLPVDTMPEVRALYEQIPKLIQRQSFGIEDEVVLLDLETTGLQTQTDRITEVALMKMQGPEILDTYSTLINPQWPIPEVITTITGISDEMVADAPTIEDVKQEILDFMGDRVLIAHNARFDKAFLEKELGKLTNKWMDTIYLAQIGLPRLVRYSQPTLAQWLHPDAGEKAHRAAADVAVLSRVWRAALCGMSLLDYRTLRMISELPCMGCGAEHLWAKQVLGARGDADEKTSSLRSLRHMMVKTDQADPLNNADHIRMNFSYNGDIMDVVEKLQKKHKKAAKADVADAAAQGSAQPQNSEFKMYDDFELRPAQREMANAVYNAFLQSHFLAVEAATGVGKSLAYLLPAALVAEENQVSIGIATRSNNLTDQLLTREIPRLNKLLGGTLRYTAVKGYENYVCLRKVDSLIRNGEHVKNLAHIIAWISQSPWGDIARISMASKNDKTYVATQQECTNKKCKYYPNLCYLHGTRKRAQTSHLVVTNQSLLFRDAVSPKPILPPIRYWVVDEAHAIEKVARDQLSSVFDLLQVSNLLRHFTTRHSGLAQRLDNLLRKSAGDEGEKSSIAQTLVTLSTAVDQATTIFVSLRDEVAGLTREFSRGPASREIWINQEMRSSALWGIFSQTARSLYTKLERIAQKSRALLNEMSLVEDIKDDDLNSELNGFMYDVMSAASALGIIIDEPQDNLVYSIESFGRSEKPHRLVAAPLEVGSIINDEIYANMRSVVFTSATMTVSQDFKHFKRSIGLDRVEPVRLKEKSLKAGYQLDKQMRIFVVSDLPDPREAAYQNHLSEFSERMHLALGGGVLSLFTNRRDMEYVYDAIARNISNAGLEVQLQREGSSAMALGKEFIEDKERSLMALRSFWEGFDAKGDTLKCVFIPKLPFATPGTPLASERNVREGTAAWARYDLPEAIIDLRQAIGRLIRSSKDTGYVILGDSRLVTKNYGKRVLKSLPVEAEIMTSEQIVAELSAQNNSNETQNK